MKVGSLHSGIAVNSASYINANIHLQVFHDFSVSNEKSVKYYYTILAVFVPLFISCLEPNLSLVQLKQ